jgi:nicotinamidase-related amidase
MKKALLIIDVQNFYFQEGGLEGAVEASLKAKELLNYFREKGLLVIHVKHLKKVQENQKYMTEIHENVKPIEGEIIIAKPTPGSFNDTNLLEILREKNIDELIICGMMSHMCVDTTTREAFDLGFKCTAIHDACATRKLEFKGKVVPAEYVHASAMAALEFAFAKVISVNEFMDLN